MYNYLPFKERMVLYLYKLNAPMSLPRDVSVRIHKLNCMFLASSFIIGGNFIDHLCSTPNVKYHIICNTNYLKQI